jgi:hypothetical protein
MYVPLSLLGCSSTQRESFLKSQKDSGYARHVEYQLAKTCQSLSGHPVYSSSMLEAIGLV